MFYKLSQLTDSRAGVQIQAMELQALCYDLCEGNFFGGGGIRDLLDIRNPQQMMFIFKADLSQAYSRQIRNQSYI